MSTQGHNGGTCILLCAATPAIMKDLTKHSGRHLHTPIIIVPTHHGVLRNHSYSLCWVRVCVTSMGINMSALGAVFLGSFALLCDLVLHLGLL